MAIGNTVGEFNATVTSSTFERRSSGGIQVLINLEGTATGYGTIQGTLTLIGDAPGATSGSGNYTGAAFLESGETVSAVGEGFWEQLGGENKWRVRGINSTSQGDVLLSEGILDLATRSYGGSLTEWT